MDQSEKSQTAKNYIWNTLGSAMSAASSFILLFAVTRTMGPYAGGIFSLAYALSQQFQTLGAYEMRPYQATDATAKYSFSVYFASRVLTCILMLGCVIGYSVFTNGFSYEALLIVLVASLKLFDAFEDVFHGAFQQRGRLDVAGKAFFFRVLVTTVTFCASVAIFHDLLIACIASLICSLVALLALNIPPAARLLTLRGSVRLKALAGLMATCFPLFLGAFLATYLTNAPKFGIEEFCTKDIQTFYSVLFMPTLAINLLNQFAFKPLLTTLAQSWTENNLHRFCSILAKSIGVVFTAFVALCITMYPFGTPLLGWIYNIDLSSYRPELMVLLLGGVLSALSIVLYYGLVTMRKQGAIFFGYALSAGLAICIATPLISSFGIMGAAMLYVLSFAFLSLIFGFCFVRFLLKAKKRVADTV